MDPHDPTWLWISTYLSVPVHVYVITFIVTCIRPSQMHVHLHARFLAHSHAPL